MQISNSFLHEYLRDYGPEIGNVDEGIIERCEDTGDTEDEFTWWGKFLIFSISLRTREGLKN